MDYDQAIMFLVLGIALYIILRISGIARWMRLNMEMQKATTKSDSMSSFRTYEEKRKRAQSTRQHHIALKRAKAYKPKNKKL